MNQPDAKPPLKPSAPLPDATRPALPAQPRPFDQSDPPTFAQKMFGPILWTGWVQLVLICIAAGATFEAGGINPFAPNFTISSALTAMASGAFNVLSWVMQVGWRPLLTGAIAVLPIWLLWRAVVAMFTKGAPAAPTTTRGKNQRSAGPSKRWPDVV